MDGGVVVRRSPRSGLRCRAAPLFATRNRSPVGGLGVRRGGAQASPGPLRRRRCHSPTAAGRTIGAGREPGPHLVGRRAAVAAPRGARGPVSHVDAAGAGSSVALVRVVGFCALLCCGEAWASAAISPASRGRREADQAAAGRTRPRTSGARLGRRDGSGRGAVGPSGSGSFPVRFALLLPTSPGEELYRYKCLAPYSSPVHLFTNCALPPAVSVGVMGRPPKQDGCAVEHGLSCVPVDGARPESVGAWAGLGPVSGRPVNL